MQKQIYIKIFFSSFEKNSSIKIIVKIAVSEEIIKQIFSNLFSENISPGIWAKK